MFEGNQINAEKIHNGFLCCIMQFVHNLLVIACCGSSEGIYTIFFICFQCFNTVGLA